MSNYETICSSLHTKIRASTAHPFLLPKSKTVVGYPPKIRTTAEVDLLSEDPVMKKDIKSVKPRQPTLVPSTAEGGILRHTSKEKCGHTWPHLKKQIKVVKNWLTIGIIHHLHCSFQTLKNMIGKNYCEWSIFRNKRSNYN